MGRLPPKPSTIKKLFAFSGNLCAFPGCKEPLVTADGEIISEICHIEAAEKGGERFNGSSNDEYRRSYENLILLCGTHHKITNNEHKYTAIVLKEMKSQHEKKHQRNQYSVSEKIVDQATTLFMSQENKNIGNKGQIFNQANSQLIGSQIGTQHIHNYNGEDEKNKPHIVDARKVIKSLKALVDDNKKIASPPDSCVIDYQNELHDKISRPIHLVPVKYLKFRKDNGRIKADVESYEKAYNIILDEGDSKTQLLLKDFLSGNDKEKNEELQKLLIHKGQKDPAIITCDGFLINGNRRKVALEELYNSRNQDPKFEMMRVVILPDGVTELDVQKIENRYQLQGEGKSEYHGLNRALTIRANIERGFTLEAQLKDDPNYHDLPLKEFAKKVEDVNPGKIDPLSPFQIDPLKNDFKKGLKKAC